MKLSIFRDKRNFFRWHLKAANGRIVADGGEGYTRKIGVMRALRRIRKEFGNIEIIDTTKNL